ncbi:MAG: CRTAC1 family protein [Planctomycetota bacterium]
MGSAKTWAIVALAAVLIGLPAAYFAMRPARVHHDVFPDPAPVPQTPAPPAPTKQEASLRLKDVTAESGIAFLHTDGSSGRRYIVEAMSTGIATFDYDGDGLIDIYFPNGAPLPGYEADEPPRHALYRNLGGWRFEDVTEAAGVVCTSYGVGVTAADYDNDGDADLYLSNFGPNVLFRNNGDGTFADVTASAGVAGKNVIGAGACFLDYDGDGLLDLYVGNYTTLDYAGHRPHFSRGQPSYPSPSEYPPLLDSLYRNNGDGTFTDVSEPSGVAAKPGRSMGMICVDFDNDRDTDVFICNDVQENFFFRNDGQGRFEEISVLAGTAMSRQGELIANMGVDCADYDHDGLLDLFTTNYQGQLPMLFRNYGDGIFEDVAVRTNASAGTYRHVNWGTGLVDFDNDGHKDIFIANGHTEDNIEKRDRNATYRCPNVLLRNTGAGRFVDVSAEAGDGLRIVEASRGTAFDDLDNDGDVDAVILNSRTRPTVLRNMLQESGGTHHWLQIRLRGQKANRDGVGAHVTVVAGDHRQLQEVHSGRGYQGHSGTRLHFGLGPRDRVDRVEVAWIGGATEVFEDIAPDRLVTLVEGSGRTLPGSARRIR